ncbi:alpha-glucosidase family protein [Rhizobium sp. L1K21]|nr:alpha-glucosidase family protein [Rhizobium sp. L1K21]MCO6188223.1 alpha-glucosidase family protein [Rhizobium sp. L1K21]
MSTSASTSTLVADKDWWRGAVIYQIYPRSFQDSDGNGIGDLAGITSRLSYVANLGADAIWISPFFTSPMKDFGYDVSNYTDVDPTFGTLGDFDGLIEEAHRLGIRVMIDLVLSHTSDQHPWFIESRTSKDNAKSDWYVWSDPQPDGSPPNNWLSIFGGSAWAWDATRCQYYLHNFLTQQPDLNLHNADVQDALLSVVRFWLDRGVDGFRLDTINFYFHDKQLRSNPPLPADRRNASIAPAVNPYNYQEHLYDKNQPENLEFLKRFRAVLDEYPAAAAVGEVGDAQRGLEIAGEYTSGGDKVQMCYAFELLSAEPMTPARVADVQEAFQAAAPEGWACWAFSNHDVVRHISRWSEGIEDTDAFAKVLNAILLSLRGSACLYEGEELGLPEAELQFEDLQDPYGIQFWPDFKGRDGCRTPMVWEPTETGGFSSVKPWLPVPPAHVIRAVSLQEEESHSVLTQYRRFLAFRKQHLPLKKGDIRFIERTGKVLAFERSYGNETLLCCFNMSGEDQTMTKPNGDLETLEGHGLASELAGNEIRFPAWGAYFARVN